MPEKISSAPPEIDLDPQERWWTSKLNQLAQVRRGRQLPERVRLRDCTLREGEETPGTRLSDDDKVILARAIEAVGLQEIEIGYVGAVDEHRNLARRLRSEGIGARLASVNRSYAREGEWQAEIDLAAQEGVDAISLVVFCNHDLMASVPWLSQAEVPERVHDSVAHARAAGVEVSAVLAAASRTEPEWIRLVCQAAAAGGAHVFGIADSMGCAQPEAVDYLVHFVRDAVGPEVTIGFHGHNTFGLATANALAAVRAGASVVDAVPLGLGEGAGIAPLEELVFALEILYGVETGVDIGRVADLCREVKRAFEVDYLPTKSIVGEALFRHSIDSHIASILRGKWHSWECFQPALVGQARRLEFGYAKIRRGRSGAVAAKIEQMGLEANDTELDAIIDLVQSIAAKHRFADEEQLEGVIRQVLGTPNSAGPGMAGR